MIPKIITVVFAINAISAANGFVNVDSKLRVLEPILKCYEGNAHEFAGLGTLVAHLNLDSDADDLELSCVHAKVSRQTKMMQDKLNQDIFKLD